ncbi:MAG: 23S rRNA pseudouridine(2604) synthase RluF [Rikenellaceae bacterium]
METRLNKFISDSGYCSRREADRFIEDGKVTINKVVATLGSKVGARDQVRVNGNLIENDTTPCIYIALNKPVGVTSTTDRSDRTNVVDFVNYPSRIFHIGRLDKDSEGLLLLTNDGDIVNKILRAGNNHQKEYEVWVDKPLDNTFAERMSSGIKILGTTTKKCKVQQEGVKMFRITLTQGLNRQIRRMCEALGYQVTRLRRVRIMNIKLAPLALGQWRELEPGELRELMASLKESDGEQAASAGAGAGKKIGKKSGAKSPTKSPATTKTPKRTTERQSGKNNTHTTHNTLKQTTRGRTKSRRR